MSPSNERKELEGEKYGKDQKTKKLRAETSLLRDPDRIRRSRKMQNIRQLHRRRKNMTEEKQEQENLLRPKSGTATSSPNA